MKSWKIKGGLVVIVLVNLIFYGLIGLALYITNNANCLWAILLKPDINYSDDEKEDEDV